MRTVRLPRQPPDAWAASRVVAVVAHPDDEVLGCGALLAGLQDVTVVHVTDGAPRHGTDASRHGFGSSAAYAEARHAEAVAALAIAGLSAERLHGLMVADQETPAHLVAISRHLRPFLDGAALVLTHAFEGGHGDHDAVAFAVHAACRLLPLDRRPALSEMPFYHADHAGWVRQRFLPVPASLARPQAPGDAEPVVLSLTPAERDLKARMVEAHATQAGTLRDFALDREQFRPAPPYDFRCRPHGGPLLYERHGWSLTWPQWTASVDAATATLALAEP